MFHTWLRLLLQPVYNRMLASPAFAAIVEDASGRYNKEDSKTAPVLRASIDPTALEDGIPSSLVMGAGAYKGQLWMIGDDGLADRFLGAFVDSAGAINLDDNVGFGLGSGSGGNPDVKVLFDGTKLLVSQLTPDTGIEVGVDGAGLDLTLFGDTAGCYVKWDQSLNTLSVGDNTLLGLGTGAAGVPDIGALWNGTKLLVSQLTLNSAIELGVDGAGIDLKFFGDTPGVYVIWDQSADSMIFGGGALLVAGAASFTETTLAGPSVATKGANTAAAGANSANAGVLPARTAKVYVVTDADDTKGVRIHADDDVAGTEIFIWNAVNNKILKIYGPTGATINGAGVDAAFSTSSGGHARLYCNAPGTWFAAP